LSNIGFSRIPQRANRAAEGAAKSRQISAQKVPDRVLGDSRKAYAGVTAVMAQT
jgi:hypothetical protein